MVRDAGTPGRTDGGRPRVFLASRSPRRRSLLDEHGVAHEAAHPGFDDAVLEPGKVRPEQWVASLAYLKANAGLAHAGHGPVVIGADTVCVKDGRIIGTPRNADEARTMLRDLASGEHDVLTGVALIDTTTDERELFVDRARVRLGPLSDAQIESYVASGEWQGKAGGYNLRDRLHAGWALAVEGDETTVMGLPMAKLLLRLKRLLALGTAS